MDAHESDGHGECKGCEALASLNDLGLCETCAAKLDRDMIRARDWEYSITAFGVPHKDREDLRNRIIKEFGRNMELIAEETADRRTKETQKKKKAKRRKQRHKAQKG